MARSVTLFTGQWADLPLELWLVRLRPGAMMASNSPAGVITSVWTRPSPAMATAPGAGRCSRAMALACTLSAIIWSDRRFVTESIAATRHPAT